MPFLTGKPKLTKSQYLNNISKKEGLRHAIFNILGDKYIGEWKNNFKTGKGALLTRFQQLYEGDFENGYRHGFGVLSYQNEENIFILEYRGNWIKGKMHGFGLRRYRDGSVYIGNWKNGKRDGYGLMWYTNGNFYAGNFTKDKREGLGMLVLPNSNRYEGNWHNDLKHGKGRYLHLTTGQIQQGVWIEDICVFCTFFDIRYRQTSIYPTKYPIPKIELLNVNEICNETELKALFGAVYSCLTITEDISTETNVI